MAISEKLKTSFQKNMEQTINNNWYKGDTPTGREVIGRIGQISKNDPQRANDLYGQYKQMQNDATSPFYNPYTKPTNAAVSNLAAMGVDVSNINDDWYNQNSWLKNYYTFSGTTNTPSKPGKKASAEEKAAYEYYQLAKSEEATKKVEEQWNALKEELSYWANRKDRNYSDDEIIGKIDWSNYKALTDLEDNAKRGAPTELNRAIDFSRDNMYAVLWAARNGGGTGNMEGDLIASAMGAGNQWQNNQALADRLNPQSENYNPYAVGSTLEQEGLYFNRSDFNQQWLDNNRSILAGNDETAIKNWQNVYAAEERTQKAETEIDKLNAALTNRLKSPQADPDKIISWLEKQINTKSDYATLKALNESLGSGKLLATTRALDFGMKDIEDYIREVCNEKTSQKTEDDKKEEIVADKTPEAAPEEVDAVTAPSEKPGSGSIGTIASSGGMVAPSQEQKETNKQLNQNIADGYDAIGDDATDAERLMSENAGSIEFESMTDWFTALRGSAFNAADAYAKKAIKSSVSALSSAILQHTDLIATYEQTQSDIASMQEQADALREQLGELATYGQSTPQDIYSKLNVDGREVQIHLMFDASEGTFKLMGTRVDRGEGEVDQKKLDSKIEASIKAANEFREQNIRTNYETELTDEQIQQVETLRRLESNLKEAQDYISANEASYRKAVIDTDLAKAQQIATTALLLAGGMDVSDLQNTAAVTDFLTQFTKYDPTQWNAYSAYNEYAMALRFSSDEGSIASVLNDAKAADDEVAQALDAVRWALDYADRMGMEIPDGVRQNMERYASKLERQHQEYEYFALTGNDDFKEKAAAGEEKFHGKIQGWDDYAKPDEQALWDILSPEQQADVQQAWEEYSVTDAATLYLSYVAEADLSSLRLGMNKVDELMTGYEYDTYYYLLETQGIQAAQDYYDFLSNDSYGVLQTRAAEEMQAFAQDYGEKHPVLANVQSVLLAPVAAISGSIYAIQNGLQKAAGQDVEFNPNNIALTYNLFRQGTMEGTMNRISEAFGGNDPENQNAFQKLGQKLAETGLEIFRNRGDSLVNGMFFGGLFPGMGNIENDMLKEFVSALPMGMSAGVDAAAEAKRKGASDEQAYAIAGVTVLAETATEAISLENIRDAYSIGGKDAVASTLKAFMQNWLAKAGPSEAIGESLNAWIENAADRFIRGEDSDHAQLVKQYEANGMSPEDAEAAALRDEWAGYLHTALVSFITPGLDIVSYAAGKFNGARERTRTLQQELGLPVSVFDVMRMDRENQRRAEAEANAQQNAEANTEEQTEQEAPATEQAPAEQTEQAEQTETPAPAEAETVTASELTEEEQAHVDTEAQNQIKDWENLENVEDATPSVQTAAVASVLDIGATPESSDMAKAAAQRLGDIIGNVFNGTKTTAKAVSDLLVNAWSANVDSSLVKQALENAALGGEESAAWRVMNSQNWQEADGTTQVNMLVASLTPDGKNAKLNTTIQNNVLESRIAEKTKQLLAQGGMKSAEESAAAADAARQATAQAQKEYDSRHADLEAKAQNLQAASYQFQQDPGSHAKADMVNHALSELTKSSEVDQEYQQQLNNAMERQAVAERKAEQARGEALAAMRQQAQQMVDQENQQRADARAQAIAEEQAKQAEAQKAQAEHDEKSGKAWEDKRDSLIEDLLNRDHLEGEEREAKRQEYLKRAEQIKLGKIDMTGLMDNAEGFLAVSAFGRKMNLQFELSDTLGNARGKYQNGVVYLNSNLIKQGKMTVGQALVEASLHEITHSMENTRNYKTYRKLVLESLFGGDQNKLDAAIEQKQADYRRLVNQELSRPDAEREIIADFARTHLNNKEVVQRFMDAGFGGKMRNTLHNINQALKNFRLRGEERTTAEYLRRAERAFQKAMNEAARSEVHPEGGQFSVMQFAQSAGLTFNEETLALYDENGKEIDGVNNKVTVEMMNKTPVGMLIDAGLTGKQNAAAKQMMTDLMNMVARYKDSNLVWEIGASTLSSTFSAIKSNSDPQYKTTVDFGTVCAKTQAIIDVMSQVMLDRVKEGKSGGLTREDIMKVYDATHNAGLSVPCPVCYVFSRWMGVPSLLGQMSQYQKDYVVTKADGSIDVKATQAKVDAYIQNAEEKYGSAKEINNKKARLQSQLAELEKQQTSAMSETEEKELLRKMTDIENQIGEVSAYNWITQALCKKNKDGTYTVDPKFKLTPDEILFDLNRTGKFAGYEKNWKYRNTRGAGMGKAIMPYSGETIGDVLYGVKASGRQSNLKNPWLNMDPKAAQRQLNYARERARKQNLVGGQRLQSTSDFRPEWGLDYIMSFLELQAAGSKTQMYTKVAEAVDFFASVGADVNLSIMGKGQGWHEDENGNKVLDFSSITGMDYGTAKALKNKYDNVQMILVGMNDTHIRLAMANSDIDFIIPWHSSGNSKDVLAGLISSVGEKLDSSVDYTTTQTDMVKGTVKKYTDEHGNKVEYTVPGKQTAEEKLLWDARVKLLTKGGDALTLEERTALMSNPITKNLYDRFTKKGVDPDCYGVKLSKDQANQIFPYEYWDTTSTKENADINGQRFVEYCEAMGIVPRFSQFKDDPGYWKLLIDRPMYNNDGSYHQQQVIDVTNARIGALNDNGILEGSDLPSQAQAKYAPKDRRNANYEKYTEAEKRAIENAKAMIDERYDDGTEGQYSVFGDTTMADMEEAMADTVMDYQSAVDRGDMEAAQDDLDYIRETAGDDAALDTEYMDAVRRGDRDKLQEMVDQRAAELKAEVFAATDVPAYKVRRRYQPKQTIKVYKTFTLDDEGRPSALFVSSKNALPVGVWLDAQDTFHFTSTKNGKMYVPSTKNPNTKGGATGTAINLSDIGDADLAELERLGHIKRKENGEWSAKALTSLAYRPGWHAGDMPFFPQGGMQIEGSNYDNVHRYNQVVFECEMAADQDYTSYDIRDDGSVAYHDRQEMPVDGSYKFATNPMANAQDIGAWYISGALKINRALTELECNEILAQNGRAPQEWQQYQDPKVMRSIKGKDAKYEYEHTMGPLDLDALGYDPNATDGGKKLLDPITYDDDGNVIPLSQRFNAEINDPRYSAEGETTLADMEQAFSQPVNLSYDDVERVINQANNALSGQFAKEYDAWDKKTGSQSFKLGKPVDVLKEAGAPDEEIILTGKKLAWIRNNHHGMSDEVIKQIPSIVTDPVLVMESDSVPGRLVMFGEVMNDDGFPVLAALSTEIEHNTHTGEDFVLLNSAYGKDFLLQNFIDKAKILYRDENRADTWAAGLRLELPSASAVIGSSDASIAQDDAGVNSSMVTYNNTAYLNESTVDQWLRDYAASNPNYAQAYIAYINPDVFLDLTTTKMTSRIRIYDETGPFDEANMQAISPNNPMFLRIDGKTGEIYGHEGRHRAVAMSRAGIKQVPVLLFDYDSKYSKTHHDSMLIRGQSFDDGVKNRNKTTLYDVTPLSTGNRDTIVQKFGVPAGAETEGRMLQYSAGGENTLSDIDQELIDSGIITQEDLNSLPLEGRNPVMSTGLGPAQRQFGQGMLQDSDEIDQRAKGIILAQNSYYPDTNEDQINRAIKWIRGQKQTPNSDGFAEALQAVTSNNFDYRSADGQARMIAVMGMAAAKNDILAQTALADAFNRQGTDLGRALQSRKLFRLMTPEGRISTLQKMLQDQQDELDSKGMNVDLKFSEWVLRAASVAEDEADFRKVQQAAAIELAQQVPASWRDKLRGWRMLSMLGNPRTHIRNIIGNALFVPVVGIKNKLGAVGEIATRQEQRTKTLAPFLKKEVRNFARKDAQAIKDMLTGDAKYNEGTQVKREMKPFKGLLQAIIDLNGNALEGEDWFFLKGHYRRAFGGWMQANGYTEAQLENDAELLEKGRAYVIQEAQKATYRDFNGLAQRLNQLTRNPKTTGQKVLAFGVEAALPFKKTPANILKRGLEYSPVGLIRSLTSDIYHLHQWDQYQDGKLRAMPEGAISPNQFIDRICSGLSGTMIMAVGAFLGHAGIITCGLDDDEDKLEKEQGNQEYSIKIAGHTFTVDWAAPMSMPFFVGAAIQEQLANQEGFDIEELVNAFGNIAEPVFNLSMLDGINSLFKTSQFDDTDAITQIGAKIASNYATSYVPSLLGAIARTIDDTRRKAFVESGKGSGPVGTFRYAYEQVQNKIPGWSQTNIPYRNVWGEAETSGLAERILENFILPGYITEYGKDPVLNEMARLYDSTGDSSMIPSDPAKTVTYKKQKYVLTAEQWDTYKAERGQAALNVLTELINSPDYLAANDSTQLQMVKEAWSYADQVGKSAIIPDYEMNARADAATIARNGKITSYKDDMMTALTTGDYEGYETMVEALREEGVEDSTIKGKISDYYRDRYKDAYRKNDYAKMAEIEDILDNTDFTFNIDGKGGWQEQVDKEND